MISPTILTPGAVAVKSRATRSGITPVSPLIAAHDMCGAFVDAEPARRADVLWGALACLALDARASAALLHAWAEMDGQGAR